MLVSDSLTSYTPIQVNEAKVLALYPTSKAPALIPDSEERRETGSRGSKARKLRHRADWRCTPDLTVSSAGIRLGCVPYFPPLVALLLLTHLQRWWWGWGCPGKEMNCESGMTKTK